MGSFGPCSSYMCFILRIEVEHVILIAIYRCVSVIPGTASPNKDEQHKTAHGRFAKTTLEAILLVKGW